MMKSNNILEDMGRSFSELYANKYVLIFSAAIGAVFSEIINLLIENQYQFIAIGGAVGLDALLGIIRAIRDGDFATSKSFKSVFMLGAFWLLLACTLLIEKGFHYTDWMSEAVFIPILIFQVISILKNLNLLNLIDTKLLNQILGRIDKHKEKKTPSNEEDYFSE